MGNFKERAAKRDSIRYRATSKSITAQCTTKLGTQGIGLIPAISRVERPPALSFDPSCSFWIVPSGIPVLWLIDSHQDSNYEHGQEEQRKEEGSGR